ncbi:hypothetical protein A7K94_0203195 [Modestobacter sp. VKM Ac-2676]|nr:hypothetical protein A7K94_0203195 [Modestobacter sp. VKM Ac-2676]
MCGGIAMVVAACAAPSGDGPPPAAVTTTVVLAPPAAATSSPTTEPALPTTEPTLQSAYDTVRSGVVRLEVAGCGAAAIGSGFALSDDLVATAAHVVEGGQVIRVIQGTTATAGQVIGIDRGADVALVRTTVPLSGHVFRLAPGSPEVGDEIAALGFPEGQPLSFNTGTVNGLERKAVIEGIPRHDLVEIDAATTHGNSGGPVIRADGQVVGIVDAGPDGEPGRRLAVSIATARPLIDAWSAAPEPGVLPSCTAELDPDGVPLFPAHAPTSDEMQAITTLDVYFRAINLGDFPTAAAQLVDTPDVATFRAGVASSQDVGIRYRSVVSEGDALVVWVTFTSHQDQGRGPAERPEETCTDWSLDYVMTADNGLWLIADTRPHDGAGSAPCAAGPTD